MLAYLLCLLVSISGLAVLDARYKLAFWNDKRAAAKTIGLSMLAFTVWDALGIALGIFYNGESRWDLPIHLFPEFPLEEFFFLFLLSYVTLLTYQGVCRRC